MTLGKLKGQNWPAVGLIASLSLLLFFTSMGAPIFAAEQAEKKEATETSKESFNLILPFKDLTVGQGQEATMDAEVVNRTRQPVEVSLSIDSVPQGWDINFNSRYPSYPVRSVMVQASDQTNTKSTTLEFKAKIPDNTKPGTYPVKVTAKDSNGPTQYVATVNFRVT